MIAYLVHRFPVSTQTFTFDEVQALRQNGLSVEVVTFRPGEDLDWSGDGLDVRVLPPTVSPYARALAFWVLRAPRRVARAAAWAAFGSFQFRPTFRERLANLLALPRGALLARDSRIGLFHAQFANETATTALVAAHLTGQPFSFRSHTARNPQLLATKLQQAALVLSISEHDMRLLRGVAPSARVEVARLGVKLPSGGTETREPGLVVSIGSLIEKKGHDVLIEACRLLAANGIEFRCEIAGEGPLAASLEAQIDGSGLKERVVLLGRLDRSEVDELLERASCFVLASVPSPREGIDGLPVALLEAAAHALPLVASRIAAVPELVVDGETGILVPPSDAEALADAVATLLTDASAAAGLGLRAREVVAVDYSRDAAYARVAALLAEVCDP
jgi:colanic acid/amylovoran biosynthesis glycosyltransferase